MPTIQFFQPHEGRRFDGPLDLNEQVIRHPSATFFMRAGGDGLRESGIRRDDLLVIDRSIEPVPGRVAVVVRNGEMAVERLRADGGEAEVWGVVTHLLRDV